MSLTIIREPHNIQARKANDLDTGTWFMDSENQIHVVVLDDRTIERRILCAGNFYAPFIANIPLKNFEVNKVLLDGTLLQITAPVKKGDYNEI